MARANYLDHERRDALLAALAEMTVSEAHKMTGIDLSTCYAWDSRRFRAVCICGQTIHTGPCSVKIMTQEMAAEIRRLREDQNLTRSELVARFGVSMSSVSTATAGMPFRGRRSPTMPNEWTKEEVEILRQLYPSASWKKISEALPARRLQNIQRKASFLGLRRAGRDLSPERLSEIPAEMLEMRRRRNAIGVSAGVFAQEAGFSRGSLLTYETGHNNPSAARLAIWRETLSRLEAAQEGATPAVATTPETRSEFRVPPLSREIAPRIYVAKRESEVAAAAVAPAPSAVVQEERKPRPAARSNGAPPPLLSRKPAPRSDQTVSPSRVAEAAAIEEFIARRGATRVPAVGDPELSKMDAEKPLKYDPKKRKYTRGGNGIGYGSWGFR
jgi:transcriptional regulator with XRE-family HTH domain